MATSSKLASIQRVDGDRLTQLLGTWSSGRGPLYRLLADGIAELIDQGALRDGVRLPSERSLAGCLSVSRSTTVAAYGELQERGLLRRRRGSGTEVVAEQTPAPEWDEFRSSPLFGAHNETRALLQAVPECLIDLRAEFLALAEEGPLIDTTVEPEGWWELRQAVAERYARRGVPTDPNQILITSGTQQACSLVLTELCRPGDIVITEALTWPGLADSAERVGARCHGIAMDDDGIDIGELRRAVERLRPAAIVLNPHQHNPTGTCLPPSRRRELAALAFDYGVPLVEDRVFADISFHGEAPAPLPSHEPRAPIVVVDSLSKTVWSGLRLGWIRGSTDLIGRLRLVKAIDDLGTSMPSQLLARRMLDDLDDHIERRRTQMAARSRQALSLVTATLPDWSVAEPVGGSSLWAELPDVSARAFVRHAARSAGVLLVGDSAFAVGEPQDRFVRLPFTADPDSFADAMHRVAEAWRTFEPGAPTDPSPSARLRPTLV